MIIKSITKSLRKRSIFQKNNLVDFHRLETHIQNNISKIESRFNFNRESNFKISKFNWIGGGFINNIYSFLLTDTKDNKRKKLPLILKTYQKNTDPVRIIFSKNMPGTDMRLCIREWEVLKYLEEQGFNVPKVFFCESNSQIIGYPFLIMSKIKKFKKNNFDYIDPFAKSLAAIHNINLDKINIKSLRTPKDGYEFAKRWPMHFKYLLQIETKHSNRMKKEFDFSINWLKSKVYDNFCPTFSLIHGDTHPGNAFLVENSNISLVDWDSVRIGDPAYDVGNAYHMIKFFSNPKDPDKTEQFAQRFLTKYLSYSKFDIRPRLEFYKLVALLGYSITYSSGLSSPIKAYQYHKRKVMNSIPILKGPLIFFIFPFLRWPFFAKQVHAENDIYWLQYFIKSVDKLKNFS